MEKELQLPEISEGEKTPIILRFLEIIEIQNKVIRELKDEISRLKGHPARPKLMPSKTGELNKAAKKSHPARSKKKRRSRR